MTFPGHSSPKPVVGSRERSNRIRPFGSIHPPAPSTTQQVVHDFTTSAIALKRHFGDALKIGRPLDTQFALEALQGDIRGTVGSAIKAFTGEHDLYSDAAYRCRLVVCTYMHAIGSCPVLHVRSIFISYRRKQNASCFVFISQTRAYVHSWMLFFVDAAHVATTDEAVGLKRQGTASCTGM